MICTPSPRPPRSEWLTNLMLRDATAFIGSSRFACESITNVLRSRLRRRQSAAEEELPDARVGEDPRRGVLQPRAAELEHDPVVRVLERALCVLLDQQQRDP